MNPFRKKVEHGERRKGRLRISLSLLLFLAKVSKIHTATKEWAKTTNHRNRLWNFDGFPIWKYLLILNCGFIGISRGFPFSYTCILSYPWNFSAGLPHYERHLQPILHLIRNQLHSFCWHMPRKDSDAVSRASDESKQGNVKTGISFCIPLFCC